MTNTDTADVDGTARQVAALARAGSEIVRITVDRDEAAAAVPHIKDKLLTDGRRRAAGRRLPLHRPQAARRSSGLRRGARQIPHQSRQCRLRQEEGHAVLRHRRDGDQARQAGAHRRELGLARPGAAHAADGRERQVGGPAGRARGDARGDGAVGAAVGRARRRDRPAARQDHPVGEGLGRAGPDRGLHASSARRSNYAMHLGLTEAGMGSKGIVASSRGARHAAAAGHRRHHPHLADARAGRRPHAWK